MPKVLLWDVETSPNLGYIWGKYDQNVISFEQEWHLLSIAWKWLDAPAVYVRGLDDYPLYQVRPENDCALAVLARGLFNQADVVVAHNGVAFDTKKAQARMLYHGLEPPSPFREVDTLKIARGKFAFTSNRLDDLCKHLGIGGKRPTGGFSTWLGCMKGDPKAWAQMKRYNKHDVVLLEKLYLRLRPWAASLPPMNTADDDMNKCPRCGGGPLVHNGVRVYTMTTRQRYQCGACGGHCQGRAVTKTKANYVP